MNYFLATASYEHFLPQYFEYGFSLFKSLPHQIQQRYRGLIIFFIKVNDFTIKISNKLSSFLKSIYNFFSFLPKFKKLSLAVHFSIFKFTIKVFHNLMTKLTDNWSLQHLLDRPTSPYAVFKKPTLKSFFSSPLSKWLSLAFIGKQTIISAIKVLFSKSIPNTIIKIIMSIRIYPIKSSISFTKFLTMIVITCRHIFIKILKIQPFLTNSNSSPTIILKTIMLRIKTTLFHSTPNIIKSCSRHIMFHIQNIANYQSNVKQLCTL